MAQVFEYPVSQTENDPNHTNPKNQVTMIFLKILLLLSAAFALFWQIKIRKLLPAIITLGMVTGLVMVLILPTTLQIPGLYVYMGFVASAIIYGLIARGLSTWARLVILLMSAGIFTYWLWIINHWHGNEVLAPMLTLLVGLAGITCRVKLKDEFGFLILLATDAVAILIEHFT